MELKDCNRWDARFFALCNLVASWSEDEDRKVGSVIVGPANEIRSVGFNGLPRQVSADLKQRHSRSDGEKFLWYEHAERNAIYNLTRGNGSAERCHIYVNFFPCADCARAIIQVGIAELRTFPYDVADEWCRKQFTAAEAMFREAGITVSLYSKVDVLIREVHAAFGSAQSDRSVAHTSSENRY